MIRRVVLLLLAVVVPVATLTLAGISVGVRSESARRGLQEALVIGLAQRLDAEVRVGQVQGDPVRGFRLRDVAVSEGRSFAEGTLASVDTVEVKCNSWAALWRGTPPIEAVEVVRLIGLRGHLSRGTDGKLNIDRFLPKPAPPGAPPKPRFRGRIVAEGATLAYEDHAPRPVALRGLELRLTGIDAVADFADANAVSLVGRATGEQAPFARIEGAGSYQLATRAVSGNVGVVGADVPALYNRFVRHKSLRVLSGRADATGNVCVVPGELVDFAITGHASDVTAEVAALHGERVVAQGDFLATPAGVGLRNAHAKALGADLTADGAVIGLSRPTLDLAASAKGVDLARWSKLAPKVAASLPKVTGARNVRLQGRVLGPLRDPDITVAADFPEPVLVHYKTQPEATTPESEPPPPVEVTARASKLTATVSVPDTKRPDATVRLSAAELDVSDLGVLLPEQKYLRQAKPGPLRNVSAEVIYSQHSASTAGRVAVDEVQTDRGPVRGVEARYALVGRVIRAEASARQVFGGRLAADALIDLSSDRPKTYAQFDADNVDLSPIAQMVAPEGYEVQGRGSASGVLAAADGKLDLAAEVSGGGARLESVEVDAFHAHVGATDEALDVRYATARGPLGALWARGSIAWDGPADLEVSLADVPLAQARAAVQQFDGKPIQNATAQKPADDHSTPRGTGFAHGFVRGEWSAPQVTADVAVFGGGFGRIATDALTASVAASPSEASVSNLVACRGAAVLTGAAALREIVWPPGSRFSKEPPPPEDAPEVEAEVDGKLEGSVQVAGLDLARSDDFLELPASVRLAGVVTADLQIGGILQEPWAEGQVAASHVRVAQRKGDLAAGPIEYTGHVAATRDRVALSEGSATSEAGSLKVSGEVSGFRAEEGPTLLADFRAREVPLWAYAPAKGTAGLVDGTVESLEGTVAGPLSAPWPKVHAEVYAPEVRLARRRATEVRTRLDYSDGVLSVTGLTCGVAGGGLEVRSASYRPSDRKLFADLTARDLDARELVFLAADVAARGQDDPDTITRRNRMYAYGHRVRGRLSASQVAVGGFPGNLEGRVKGLAAYRVEVDRKSVPGLTADFHFAGLALDATKPRPPEGEEGGPPAALAHARVDGLRVRSDPIGDGVILVHGGDVTRGGSVDWSPEGAMELVAEADLVPMGAINEWLPRGLAVGGDLALTVRAEGPTEDPRVVGSFEVFRPTVAGVEFDLLQAAQVEVRPTEIAMTDGLLKLGSNEVQAHGSLPFDRDRLRLDLDGRVAFEAHVDDLPAHVLVDLADELGAGPSATGAPPSFWSRCKADGLLTARLNVAGTLRQPEVTGGVGIAQGATFRLADWSSQNTITDIGGDLLLGRSPTGVGATVEALNVRGKWQNTQFALDGQAEVSHLDPNELLDNRIDELTLTVDTPEGGKQRFPGGTVARDLHAVVKARTHEDGWHVVSVEKGSAQLGRGTATLTGSVLVDSLGVRKLAQLPCDLRLALDKAEMQYESMLPRAQVDGAIVARKFASATGRALPEWFLAGKTADDSLDPGAALLIATAPKGAPGQRGALEVTRATLGLPPRRTPSEATPARPPAQPGQPRTVVGVPSSLPAPRLDLTVALGRSVDFQALVARRTFVVAHGGVVPDGTALRLTGTPQAPELHASASMRNGGLRLLRGTLEVPNAGVSVDITPLPEVGGHPPVRRELALTSRVWGHAEGNVSGSGASGEPLGPFKIALDLGGALPPDHVLTASSEPPLSTSEVNELLAIAPVRPGEQLSADRGEGIDDMLANAVASRMFHGVLAPLQQELRETLGLEQFDITVGVNQPVELRVGKYLVKNLLVSYRRTAGGPDEEYDLRVSYQVKGRYETSWHSDERRRSEFAVQYQWRF
ncbi:MAG: hypothetical protein FJX75_07710 [Armatimonadetes bacterium]|nr:hypothetical protein [Armatimonadota bacterium]